MSGFYVYKSLWTSCIGEVLSCSRETSNLHDRFAVTVLKVETDSQTIVGHLPRSISSTCSIFLRKGGIIFCRIRYLRGLVHGGLEVPCMLVFEAETDSLIGKVQKLFIHPKSKNLRLKHLPKSSRLRIKKVNGAAMRFDLTICLIDPQFELYDCDKQGIVKGHKLNDLQVLFGQSLLRNQFPEAQGLSCTLIQSRLRLDIEKQIVQICHVRNDHWIVISNLLCGAGKIDICDGVYSDIDENTEALIVSMFEQPVELKMFPSLQKQKGGVDCGVVCIALCTFLLHKAPIKFTQSLLRPSLVSFFERSHLSPSP